MPRGSNSPGSAAEPDAVPTRLREPAEDEGRRAVSRVGPGSGSCSADVGEEARGGEATVPVRPPVAEGRAAEGLSSRGRGGTRTEESGETQYRDASGSPRAPPAGDSPPRSSCGPRPPYRSFGLLSHPGSSGPPRGDGAAGTPCAASPRGSLTDGGAAAAPMTRMRGAALSLALVAAAPPAQAGEAGISAADNARHIPTDQRRRQRKRAAAVTCGPHFVETGRAEPPADFRLTHIYEIGISDYDPTDHSPAG